MEHYDVVVIGSGAGGGSLGDNLIHTADGDLQTKDAIVLATTGAGEFAEVDTVVGGTGRWDGATGRLTATGTFSAAAGGSWPAPGRDLRRLTRSAQNRSARGCAALPL